MSRNWAERFVGIPYADRGRGFDGADCWGLGCLIYRDQRGVELPSYDGYVSAAEFRQVDAIVRREAGSSLWNKVADAADRQLVWRSEPRALDVLLFRIGRYNAHVGFWIAPGTMLHMPEGDYSSIERYDAPEWASRLTSAYRWGG